MADNQLQSKDKLEILCKFHDLQYSSLYYYDFQAIHIDAAYRVELILSYDGGHCHVAQQRANVPGSLLSSVLENQHHCLID